MQIPLYQDAPGTNATNPIRRLSVHRTRLGHNRYCRHEVSGGLAPAHNNSGRLFGVGSRSLAPTNAAMEATVSDSDELWLVRLEGDPRDLSDLASLCDLPGARVIEREGNYYLASQDFAPGMTAGDVRCLAENKLSVMNGAMRLEMREFGQVSLGAETRRGGNITLCVGPGQITVRPGLASLIVSGGNNPPIKRNSKPEEMIALAVTDDAVAKVLRLRGIYEQTWSDLYRLYEVVAADAGGLKEIVSRGWSSKGKIDSFKHTANHPDASGDSARHGHLNTLPPPVPMPINEAESLVFGITKQWLASKGPNA